MSDFSVGIDTGGTYTDAAIINLDDHAVVAAAKSLTTHHDLSIGIADALAQVVAQAPENIKQQIARVCLSTTLATNALVEGQGSSVTAILIGFDEAMVNRTDIAKAIPDTQIISIQGGHNYRGEEQQALDLENLEQILSGAAGDASAFAIASHYSVRNSAHELKVAQFVRERFDKPVSLSCDLSDSLNGPKRALTAAFNARIISLIVKLEHAVEQALASQGIDADVLIVKGDGSVASANAVLDRPIETVLSGPAASVIGARYLTGLMDFIVADIGGTTSDVATVIRGWPGLDERGADVGGYRTLVKAIDMRTLGLGGDSAVDIDTNGIIELHNQRVVPVSLLVHRWPQTLTELSAAISADSGMRSALKYLVISTDLNARHLLGINEREQEFLNRLPAGKPVRYNDVVMGAADRSAVKRLCERGILRQSGFTPSDAAHVLNLQSQWSREAAVIACELLGRASGRVTGKDVEPQLLALSQEICDIVSEKSAAIVLQQLAEYPIDADHPLVTAATRGSHRLGLLNVQISPIVPIIAVGGPAPVFYKDVGKRLSAELHLPEHGSVANAVGAGVGMVRSEKSIEITLKDTGGFTVHHDDDPVHAESAEQAIKVASDLMRNAVARAQREKGGREANIDIHVKRIVIPDMDENNGLISATVTACCDSLPER